MNRCKILIVEDEMISARGLEQSLNSLGYEVCGIACTAAEAIQMTHDFRPTLVLMDIRLSGDQSGIETACQIQNQYHISSIFLSAFIDESTREKAKSANPLGYMVKPYYERERQSTIQGALSKINS